MCVVTVLYKWPCGDRLSGQREARCERRAYLPTRL